MARIALFLPSMRGGGAERVMANLAQGFASKGYEVDLLLCQKEGPYLEMVSPSVRIIDLKSNRVLFSLPKVTRYLRTQKPMAMLCAMDHTNIVGLWANLLAGKCTRVISTVHGNPNNPAQQTAKMRVIHLLMRYFYRYADAVVAVSGGVRDAVAKVADLDPSKIRVIPNPVVTPQMFDLAEEPVLHPWFKEGEPPVIIAVGRLIREKDFGTLIRAFSHVVSKGMDSRLIILGEGEERPQLEALVRELGIGDRVWMPGFVRNPYKYIARANLFVLSSISEGLPTVLIEALSLGTPVVATDCPSGPAEILDNGRYGTLVPVGDVTQMADAIVVALGSRTDPRILRNRAMEYSVDRVSNQYLELMLEF